MKIEYKVKKNRGWNKDFMLPNSAICPFLYELWLMILLFLKFQFQSDWHNMTFFLKDPVSKWLAQRAVFQKIQFQSDWHNIPFSPHASAVCILVGTLLNNLITLFLLMPSTPLLPTSDHLIPAYPTHTHTLSFSYTQAQCTKVHRAQKRMIITIPFNTR